VRERKSQGAKKPGGEPAKGQKARHQSFYKQHCKATAANCKTNNAVKKWQHHKQIFRDSRNKQQLINQATLGMNKNILYHSHDHHTFLTVSHQNTCRSKQCTMHKKMKLN